jgi:CubicO group peptidase (beta-lactamase class C family)
MSVSRRSTLAGLAALAFPSPLAFADGARYGAALSRARGFDQLRSIVIGIDGEIAAAEAFRGPALDRPANVKSVSKTIHAALTGIAIDRGHLPGPEATIGALAPDIVPSAADPRVRDITIADLLTMRAGLERTSGANYGAWVSSRNWVADALARPMVDMPGGLMLYSTGSYHVLGAVLTEVTGASLLELARDWLGRPLGIDIPAWTRDPQGRYMGGNEMALSPLALYRIGEVFRTGGTHEGRRIVSDDWVRASWEPRTRSVWSGHAYGYGWFLYRAGPHEVAYGRGYGGQMLFVVPTAKMTVAITSDPNRPARSQGYAGDLHRLLTEIILPEADAA